MAASQRSALPLGLIRNVFLDELNDLNDDLNGLNGLNDSKSSCEPAGGALE
jgi:hypothetical protein